MPGGGTKTAITTSNPSLILRYRRRLIRKKLLWRALRKRRELRLISDNRSEIRRDSILAFTTLRNEATRLPFFLDHYRSLGVGHFFVVDNASEDEGPKLLSQQRDVTLYRAEASYRGSRFGVDWLNALLWRYAHRRWIVQVDVDETLIYPAWDRCRLPELARYLDAHGHHGLGSFMLDMYPKGPLDTQTYTPGQDPTEVLQWFDAFGYWAQRQKKYGNLWMQGGPRARVFFEQTPERAPTLNKIPLVKWRRGYAYLNSSHSLLPSRLNETWRAGISGILLHSKFLPGIGKLSEQEAQRGEHFNDPTKYQAYYAALSESPDLWYEGSVRYRDWAQLVDLGLMERPKGWPECLQKPQNVVN